MDPSDSALDESDYEMSKTTAEEDELMFGLAEVESHESAIGPESQSTQEEDNQAHVQDNSQDKDVSMAEDTSALSPATPLPEPMHSAREEAEAQVQETGQLRKPRTGPVVRGLGVLNRRSLRREDSTESIVRQAAPQHEFSDMTPEEALAKAQSDDSTESNVEQAGAHDQVSDSTPQETLAKGQCDESTEFTVKQTAPQHNFPEFTPPEDTVKAHHVLPAVMSSVKTNESREQATFRQQSPLSNASDTAGSSSSASSNITPNVTRKPEPGSDPRPSAPPRNLRSQAMQKILANNQASKNQSSRSTGSIFPKVKPQNLGGTSANQGSNSTGSIFPKIKPQNLGGASTMFRTSHAAPATLPSTSSGSGPSAPYDNDLMDLDSNDAQNIPGTAVSQEEGHAWMDIREDEEDGGSKELDLELDDLLIKKRNGKITTIQQIRLSQLQQIRKVNERRHGLGRRQEPEDTESMFFPDERDGLDNRNSWKRRSPMQDDDDQFDEQFEAFNDQASEDQSARYKANQVQTDYRLAQALQERMEKERMEKEKSSTTKKPRRKPAKDAREVRQRAAQDKLDKEREKARKKAQKKKERPTVASSSKRKPAGKGKGKAASTSKKSKRKGKEEPPKKMMNFPGGQDMIGLELLGNLTYDNAVADRARQGDIGEAPAIRASNLKDQWTQLLANVPPDLDFHKVKTDKNDLRNAAKNFGFKKIQAKDGHWLLKGMKTALYNHQLLASDWMISRECSENEPHGGINADAMGLGKTFELLATIIGNPPSEEDLKNKCKATLIVVPSSVVRQWHDEIRSHVEQKIFPRILKYKASQGLEVIQLEDCDIVITSYSEVIKSYPYPTKEQARTLGIHGLQAWLETQELGPLHQIQWYRVCLDEAHAIKNHLSKTSIACQQLKGKYRWALSGTPITNRLEELFPYLRFIRAPYSRDFVEFQKHFCDPDHDDCNSRIMVLLSTILIRRTFKDKLLGRPLIELPNTHPNLTVVRFSRQEQVLYRLLESCFREIMNHHLARGSAGKNYGVFFVQLLRLRQLTNHPFLLEQTIKDVFSLADLRYLEQELKRLSRSAVPIYEQVKQWLTEKDANDDGEAPERVPFGRSDYGTYFKMGDYLKEIPEEELKDRLLCHICGDMPTDAQISNCGHVFCRDCITNWTHEQLAINTYIECPKCQRILSNTKPYLGLRLRDDDSDSQGTSQSSGRSRKSRGKQNSAKAQKEDRNTFRPGRDDLGYEPKTKSRWLDIADRKDNVALLPSAKTIALKSELLKAFHESPEDKVLIFTQFRVSARIIGRICSQEGWGFVYFTGDMSTNQRYAAVKQFHEDDQIRIMIAGLKCGGVALNLTVANRVISLDLWWNHSVEQQAFGRVFRIGQKKESHFTRLVVANTVDQRLLLMQAEKLKAIDRAMQDDGRTIKPLSLSELAGLFGSVRESADGTMRVEADYDEDIDARDDDDISPEYRDGEDVDFTGINGGVVSDPMNGIRRGEGSGTRGGSGSGGESQAIALTDGDMDMDMEPDIDDMSDEGGGYLNNDMEVE